MSKPVITQNGTVYFLNPKSTPMPKEWIDKKIKAMCDELEKAADKKIEEKIKRWDENINIE
tara:strand:- start:801 stop:983 length:183 start_codon:yes stop_codon:yes gene_type:complete